MNNSFEQLLYTIGHSNHELPALLALLNAHDITAVVDVRSAPYSQFSPQYNREVLDKVLKGQGVGYVFLGKELGARRTEAGCYTDDKVDFGRVVDASLFQGGIERLRKGMEEYRIALMCSEKDPITCHRTILICRHLRQEITIRHILEDGSVETTEQMEERLLSLPKMGAAPLFQNREQLIEDAYDRQGKKIAFSESLENIGVLQQGMPDV